MFVHNDECNSTPMDARNKMTRLLEHQGKTLLRNAGIRVPAGDVATSPKDVKEIAEKIKYPVVIKAQVSAAMESQRPHGRT